MNISVRRYIKRIIVLFMKRKYTKRKYYFLIDKILFVYFLFVYFLFIINFALERSHNPFRGSLCLMIGGLVGLRAYSIRGSKTVTCSPLGVPNGTGLFGSDVIGNKLT